MFEYFIGQVLLAKLQGESNCDTKFHPPCRPGYCGEAQNSPERLRHTKTMNHELPDVQAGFRKGRGTKDQITNIRWIIEKAREFQKNIYFCFIDYAKAFDCVDHNKLEKS